jgi:FKBP-type peptidyl-prolyl cis-trans isomerase FkpA
MPTEPSASKARASSRRESSWAKALSRSCKSCAVMGGATLMWVSLCGQAETGKVCRRHASKASLRQPSPLLALTFALSDCGTPNLGHDDDPFNCWSSFVHTLKTLISSRFSSLMSPLICTAVLASTAVTSAWAQPEALAAAGKEAGAVVSASGLVYLSTKEGSGASPKETDTVKVHYRGFFPGGKEFDSSYKRGAPTEFPLNGVIKCWTEGVQKMKVGGKAKLTCPSAIAYGERGAGGGLIPANAVLQFEVELVAVAGR